ncbi:N-acetylmuramic acid 6-phosphate etherase [Arthrobacter monumenti]
MASVDERLAMNSLSSELGGLATERSRPDLADLDTLSTHDLVARIAAEDAQVPAAVAAVGNAITAAVDAIVAKLERGGRLIYVGAGTPGRLAFVDAAECVPTFGTDPGLVVVLIAGGPGSMQAAGEGYEDDGGAAAADLRAMNVSSNDAVVGISASGRTPYVMGALEAARVAGAVTIGISNNRGAAMSRLCDVPIEVETGPEVIAGSTRMKAGTAQKLVLNTLSTASMVKLGKTYGNLMVDVKANNEKLRIRARRIVVEATGADEEAAAAVLNEADWHAKTAIVALLADVGVPEARRRLAIGDGHVRYALRQKAGTA